MYVENIKTAEIVIISACPRNCERDKKEHFSLVSLASLLPSPRFFLLRIINDIRNSQNMYRRESEGEKEARNGSVSARKVTY
jgi:hypothetical protein